MYKLPVILETGPRSKFIGKDQLTSCLRAQIVHEPEKIKTHNASDRPLRIIGSTKLYVHVGRMTELVNYLVRKQLAVPAILRCDFCI